MRSTTEERAEAAIAGRIRASLAAMRLAIGQGDETQVLVWAIPERLACAQRPLRDHPQFGGRGQQLPPAAQPAVVRWVERVRAEGIRSIICLSHPKELAYYDPLELHPEGLLGFYRAQDLAVCSIPWPDPAHAVDAAERAQRMARVEQVKREAAAAFDQLPQPALIHCSAGIDRTPPVAAHIVRLHAG